MWRQKPAGNGGEHDLAAAMMAAARAVRNSIDRQAGNKPPQDMTTRDLVLELLAFRYAEEFADSEQYEARARVGARRLMRRAFEGIDADRLRECESVDRIIAYLVEYVTEPERQKVADLVPERMAEERSERARRG